MRKYEVMFVIRPELDEEKTTAVIEKFQNLLTAQGATVTKVEKWGKRRLAYEVKGLFEGFYVVLQFDGEAEAAAELERVLKITDEVIRHLIIRQET
ncbi:MAG TPA: 30S ribosomal protein S6 [Bacillota bacterium]|jgi:small subunit ribosomal protein S6